MAAPIKVQTGGVKIDISQDEVLALADRITGGALRTFTRAAHRQMDPVVEEARTNRQLWPIRTGRSIGATFTEDRLARDSVSVTAYSKLPYVYRMRYSRMTSTAIDEDARFARSRRCFERDVEARIHRPLTAGAIASVDPRLGRDRLLVEWQ